MVRQASFSCPDCNCQITTPECAGGGCLLQEGFTDETEVSCPNCGATRALQDMSNYEVTEVEN